MGLFKRFFLSGALVLAGATATAQYYSGEHTFDGEHKNEVSATLITGKNIITSASIGTKFHYKHFFNDQWSIDAGLNTQYSKQLYGIKARGEYHFQVKAFHMFASAEALYNRYHKYKTNEIDGNISLRIERGYWDITLGETLISYTIDYKDDNVSYRNGYTEPPTLTFGAHATLRPRTHQWNVGLLFRNYDDFYYENWNINWGLDFYYKFNPTWKLFGEFNIRPAGSMSQLASKYETTGKVGVIYKWSKK